MVCPVIDFLERLDADVALNIFTRLDDPADLVRASAVSRSWRHFVIKNGLSKQLCFRVFPQLSRTEETYYVNSSTVIEMDPLERDHIVYASLACLSTSKAYPVDCGADAVSASSTDHYQEENIVHTLSSLSQSRWGTPSYWSSKGHSDPNVLETLTYRLRTDTTIVTEIDIRPFEAYWEPDHPIYSAKYVRFRMGRIKVQNSQSYCPDDSPYVWTYTSPSFPMKQKNELQPFKLAEPILCIGGYLQIELSGMVQKAQQDGLFYTCISHVRFLGVPLKPAFGIHILQPSENFVLKYYPKAAESRLLRIKKHLVALGYR